jgi:hypothetical protein
MLESLGNIRTEIENIQKNIDLRKKEIQTETLKIHIAQQDIYKIQDVLYQAQQRELHISQIERLASIQFSRLRNQTTISLNKEDYQELEKWISRAKSNDGLIAIIKALEGLAFYSPSQVRNIHALTQKIIIEGPFKRKNKTTKD